MVKENIFMNIMLNLKLKFGDGGPRVPLASFISQIYKFTHAALVEWFYMEFVIPVS